METFFTVFFGFWFFCVILWYKQIKTYRKYSEQFVKQFEQAQQIFRNYIVRRLNV